MADTEGIQQEVAAVIVIAAKELLGLLTVYNDIGAIKFQHAPLRGASCRSLKGEPPQFMGLDHLLADRRSALTGTA